MEGAPDDIIRIILALCGGHPTLGSTCKRLRTLSSSTIGSVIVRDADRRAAHRDLFQPTESSYQTLWFFVQPFASELRIRTCRGLSTLICNGIPFGDWPKLRLLHIQLIRSPGTFSLAMVAPELAHLVFDAPYCDSIGRSVVSVREHFPRLLTVDYMVHKQTNYRFDPEYFQTDRPRFTALIRRAITCTEDYYVQWLARACAPFLSITIPRSRLPSAILEVSLAKMSYVRTNKFAWIAEMVTSPTIEKGISRIIFYLGDMLRYRRRLITERDLLKQLPTLIRRHVDALTRCKDWTKVVPEGGLSLCVILPTNWYNVDALQEYIRTSSPRIQMRTGRMVKDDRFHLRTFADDLPVGEVPEAVLLRWTHPTEPGLV